MVVEKNVRIPERFFDNHYRSMKDMGPKDIFEMASEGGLTICRMD